MESLELTLFIVGVVLSIVLIAIFVRAIYGSRNKNLYNEDEKNDFIEKVVDEVEKIDNTSGHNIYIKDRLHFPVSYETIQNTKPWKHRVVPTVSITQHVDHPPNFEDQTSLPNNIEERQSLISLRMIADLHKHGKHLSHSSPFQSGESSADEHYDQLSPTGSLSDASLSASSMDGNSDERSSRGFSESNIHGVKKRLSSSRRTARKTHQSPYRPSFKKTGKLTFEAHYISKESRLIIHVVKASDLMIKADLHHSNPFVRAYLVPGKIQKQQTKVKRETKEPIFDENLIFNDLEVNRLQRHKIRLKVYNHSRLKKHELVGEVDIALVALEIDTTELINAELFLKKSEASHSSILISICHEAAFSKLQVNIEEARNLPKGSMSGLNPDPYVLVKLYKKDTYEKKETLHLRNTRSPKFHETFQFHLATDFEYPLSVFSLVATVANRTLIGRDEILGHVVFSLNSPQSSALSHWKSVQSEPHKIHSKWHSLIDPDDI